MNNETFQCQYCPCLMRLVEHNDWNVLLLGSYELTERKRACGRSEILGDLIVLRDNQLLVKEENDNGGVFDFALLPERINPAKLDEKSPLLVYTAHANGAFAVYILNRLDDEMFTFESRFCIQTDANMFTSIYAYQVDESTRLCLLGDDTGHVYTFRNEQQIGCITLPDLNEPCWCLHFEPAFTLNTSGFVLIGSDDSKLRVVPIDRDYVIDLDHVKIVSEFEAGVTSVCSFKSDKSDEDMKSLTFLIGSYDEHVYEFSAKLPPANEAATSLANFRYRQRIHVKGAGIWKILRLSNDVDMFLLSNMYAGVHLLRRFAAEDKTDQSGKPDQAALSSSSPCSSSPRYRLYPISLPDNDQDPNRLVYASAVDRRTRRVWFASFYKRLVQQVTLDESFAFI